MLNYLPSLLKFILIFKNHKIQSRKQLFSSNYLFSYFNRKNKILPMQNADGKDGNEVPHGTGQTGSSVVD